MIVRWLGAFGKNGTLSESLTYELTASGECCATKNKIAHCKVGLLVKNRAVIRRFSGDVWSRPDETGNLKRGRREWAAKSSHSELWVRRDFCAIVVRQWRSIKPENLQAILDRSKYLVPRAEGKAVPIIDWDERKDVSIEICRHLGKKAR